MKIIFFGSSDFAVPSLEALKNQEDVVLVVTQPDRKKGRSQKISATAVKMAADRLGIKVFQPPDVNSGDSIKRLKDYSADVFIVVSFGQILKKALLDMPRKCCLNLHGSLLPKYRGAAPINWAIANGEKETGVTVIKMNEKMDEGDMLLKKSISIEDEDDAASLSGRLSEEGAQLVLKSIELAKSNKANFIKQENCEVSYAPKLKKEDGLIDWNWDAYKIHYRIRGFMPWPGCYTFIKKKMLKVWKARPVNISKPDSKPGMVLEIDKDGIVIAAGEGSLRIEELQLEAKRRMKAEEFIAGHKDLIPCIILRGAQVHKSTSA